VTTGDSALVRIETKLDLALTRVDDHEARMRALEKPGELERRVRFLEYAIWVAAGVAAAGGGVLGTVLGNSGI
jgi:hypothetical protein